MASAWNMFVKKIYWENKKKNKNFQFKDALKEASKRKGEMGSMSSKSISSKSMKKSSKKSSKKMRCRKSRKMRGGTGNRASNDFGSDATNLNGEGSIGVQMRAGNAN
jgi:hypothetical protein